ncbi:MAG: ATP-dependent DNA helicase RecG, partial [Patescibacteria group bacterium]
MNLESPLSELFRLADTQKSALKKLNIKTIRDLLYHFPFRYEQVGDEADISGLTAGSDATLVGTLEKMETKKSWKSRRPVSEGYLRDASGRIKLRWFNQPYIAKMWADGTLVRAVGKVSGSSGKVYLANPHLERVSATEAGLFKSSPTDPVAEPVDVRGSVGERSSTDTSPEQESRLKNSGSLREGFANRGGPRNFSENSLVQDTAPTEFFAQYAESHGITSLWFRHAINKALAQNILEHVEDPIPPEILKRYNLPTLKSALVWIHAPQDLKDAEAARKRFAFEEVFLIQLARAQERHAQAKEKSFVVGVDEHRVKEFTSAFPFAPTKAQHTAINNIIEDMKSGAPMSRLLEGDVGSGKTAVAATAAFATVATRPEGQNFGTLQVAYMAPTEILAKQHFESFIKYFEQFPINIGLITGSGCFKFPSKSKRGEATNISRVQLLKWVANGEIPVLIGTHALIQKSVEFKHLALVVIDEQHRFGTKQRRALAKKKEEAHLPAGRQVPHLLSMTATPIPRTLALTIYGDLDLTLLDEMPPGRKPVITEIIKPDSRAAAYQHMRRELTEGRQAYVICPRIDEPDPDKAFAIMAKSVKAEAKRLKTSVFPEYEIEILHSKMTPKEKDDVMQRFSNHEIDILVATSVVEVGVNVPNATMIFIEGAERFGLSQLHQLRGRVVRSTHQAYCYVAPETRGEKTMERLKALTKAKNGFELAELDLMQRGPGELSGRQQWGISDIGMEALKNLKLVEAAR